MGPLAGLLSQLGHDVSGSDLRFDRPIGPKLQSWGVRCLSGFCAEHLASDPELVVVGNSVRADNPEARAALERGLPTTHIGGALQRFVLPNTRPLVVAGTHGKTTTSALATSLLIGAGLAPGYLIGGVPKGLGRSFQAPPATQPGQAATPFVIEGDEYDTAFFEKTAKFLHYQAQVAVLTSLEHDHIDIYPTLEDYRRPFQQFVRALGPSGVIVANAEVSELRGLLSQPVPARVVWYALEGRPTGAVEPTLVGRMLPAEAPSGTAPGSRFSIEKDGQSLVFSSRLAGAHNVHNALGALGAVHFGYGVDLRDCVEPLAAFGGVARRQDLMGSPGGVLVYDDFAHHPTAVYETLQALRTRHPEGRLFAVFEPRSATSCRNLHQHRYPQAMAVADHVLLAPVARPVPEAERLDVRAVAREVSALGTQAQAFDGVDAIVEALVTSARAGDVVAVLSNGTFGGLHQKLLAALSARALRPS